MDDTGDSAEIAILDHNGDILHWSARLGPVEWKNLLTKLGVSCEQYVISNRDYERWVNRHVNDDWSTDLSYWSKFKPKP